MTASSEAASIPVIDFQRNDDIITQVGIACKEWGVFYVKNHGINTEKILSKVRTFFNSPPAVKAKAKPTNGYWGYFDVGKETTLDKKDWKEGMYYRAEHSNEYKSKMDTILFLENVWPDVNDHPNFKLVVEEYLTATWRIGCQLSQYIAEHLGLEKSFFVEKLSEERFQQIGMFHYPKCSMDSDASPWGVGPHCDTGFLTVLLQDSIGGLQIKTRDGRWIEVPPIDDTLVVNMCDITEVWTNGFCHSVVHRVAKPAIADRYSVAVFIDPHLDCIITPGEAAGNSKCVVGERLGKLSSGPFRVLDYEMELYSRILKK